MTVKDIVKKYRISRQTVYNIIFDVEVKYGVKPKKQGRSLDLTPEYMEFFEKELERRGIYERRRAG